MAGRRRYAERQLSLDLGQEVDPHVFQIDEAGEHGEVFTRRWVVELILDLSGFTVDRDLGGLVAIEPSCGSGAFLTPMTERLIESCRIHDRPLAHIRSALRAFDLLPANAELAQKVVAGALVEAGINDAEAKSISMDCVRCGDFLLTSHGDDAADFVLGNPPYIRLEDVPAARSSAYRRACPTMRGRSDIFVGFIEMGLRILKRDGVLGFIVADRWMHNQYGADLRRLVSSSYAVEAIVSMHDVDAFEESVSAYPAVTVIRRAEQSTAVVANATKAFGEANAPSLTKWVGSRRKSVSTTALSAVKLSEWFDSELSWPSGDPANLALVADLERRFPSLQDQATGTRVGIGVASGADSVYLTDDPDLVEPDRLLPLLRTRDTTSGEAKWSGTHLVNPWENGQLVALDDYPMLAAYLDSRSVDVRKRHVAQKYPTNWFRTIDRVEPGLREKDKLVLPDLKAFIQPVLDRGETYPHHGLYFITSERWDLEVLGGLLLSDIAELFVATYCVKMRGGCYRFQAQYLRRIRVPVLDDLDGGLAAELAIAFRARDRKYATELAATAYDVDQKHLVRLGR